MQNEYNLKIFYSKENVGAAEARNRCIYNNLNQKFDYYLFVDDDSYISDPNCIIKLLKEFDNNNQIGVLGPKIALKNVEYNSIMSSGYEAPWKFQLDDYTKKINGNNFMHDNLREVYLQEGSCAMIHADLLIKEEGIFPSEYNYYYEETLLQSKLRLYHQKITCVLQNSYIYHLQSGGGGLSSHALFYLLRNCSYYLDDIGIKNRMPQIYTRVMEGQKKHINHCISINVNDTQEMINRRDLALKDIKIFEETGKRNTVLNEFNINASSYELI